MAIEDRRARAPLDAIDLACFELAGRAWAVPIGQVREIRSAATITPLPDAPRLIEGLVDLRGTWIPVVDLDALLTAGPASPAARDRLVVVSISELVIAFRVDRALPVVAVSRAAFEPVPELIRSLGGRSVSAAIRRPDASPLLVLDLDVLVARVLADAGPGRSEGFAA